MTYTTLYLQNRLDYFISGIGIKNYIGKALFLAPIEANILCSKAEEIVADSPAKRDLQQD